PNGHTWQYFLNSFGSQLEATDPLGRSTSAAYNGQDEPTLATDASSETTTLSYDTAGNLLSVSRPLTSSGQTQQVVFTYGDIAHAGDVTSITDPNGKVWSLAYDAVGNLTSHTDPVGN